MSLRPWSCEKCKKECHSLGLQLFSGQEGAVNFGVGWGCPSCDYKALDVCPLGPLVPTDDTCLNCGGPYPSASIEATCPGCSLSRADAMAFLRLMPIPAPDPAGVARDLFARGLFRRGLAVLNQALARDPSSESAWLLKCSFLEGIGLQNLVIPLLEGALARGGPPSLLINYSSALHQAGRFPDAARAARRYLELEPTGPWAGAARTNLGVSLRLMGDHAAAEDLYREAIEREPGQALHYRNLAQLLMDQRRWAGALGALEAGLERATTADDRIRFLEGMSYIHAEEERGAPALRSIDQAVALGASSARSHYLRGRALALLGRLEEAREEMVRVRQIEPDHLEAEQALRLLDQALGVGRP